MDAVAKARQPLKHTTEPNSKFTLRRKEFKKAEDVKLITHFAQYLSDLTEMDIKPDSLPEDLLDGMALCKLMMRIDGSGVTKYSFIKKGNPMAAFKARENVSAFQAACKRLDLPTSFGTDELESGDLGTIASTLVYVAHAAALRNVGVRELDDVLKKRIGLVSQEQREIAAAEKDEAAMSTATPSSSNEPKTEAPGVVVTAASTSTANDEAKLAPNVLSLVGLSLSHIKSLFPPDQTSQKSVSKVVTELVVPLIASKTKEGGGKASLAEILHREEAGRGETLSSGMADIVVCYDPESLWDDVLAALDNATSTANVVSASGTAMLWLEALSTVPEAFSTTIEREHALKHVIETIGRVELVLMPWDKPTIAIRSQSVYEVCCAVRCKAPMFACFLPRDQTAFLENVYGGSVGTKTFQKVFYDLNVERAVSNDPDQVFRVLKVLRSEVGTTRVNDAFIIPVKNWILEALKTASELPDLSAAKRSNLFMTRGAFHQCIGQPDEAKRFFDKVLECQQQLFPSQDNPSTATALSNMASTLRELGEFKEAEQVCERALKIRLTCYGENHPAVLVSRAWLGDILLAGGEFNRALPILEKVLEDQQKAKAGDVEVASAMNNVASALREVGRMDEARKYFDEVLLRVERSAGVDHPLYGAALNNCALTLEAQKDFANARIMHEKSLALRVRALGENHPDVALSMHNLGVCLLREDKQKNLAQAVELGKKAIAVWEKRLGPKHPTVVEAKKDWSGFAS